jgi:hypothetical protein
VIKRKATKKKGKKDKKLYTIMKMQNMEKSAYEAEEKMLV